MERTLTIKDRTGLFDVPSFILSQNEILRINFVFKHEIRIGRYRVVVKLGHCKKTFTLAKTEPIELSYEDIKECKDNIEFSIVLLNNTATQVIKDDYNIEPLKIECVNGNFAFTAKVQALEAQMKSFENRLKVYEDKLNEFSTNGVSLVAMDD